MTDRDHDLEGVYVESGVSVFDGSPFCRVEARGVEAPSLTGQLTPAEVRAMALQWLAAAEAAESDALVFAELVESVDVDPEAAAAFLVALRRRRR